MNNKFNIGDILINKKREKHHDNLELYYLVVDVIDTYTIVKRIDDNDIHSPSQYPTVNMDWFFETVSRA